MHMNFMIKSCIKTFNVSVRIIIIKKKEDRYKITQTCPYNIRLIGINTNLTLQILIQQMKQKFILFKLVKSQIHCVICCTLLLIIITLHLYKNEIKT